MKRLVLFMMLLWSIPTPAQTVYTLFPEADVNIRDGARADSNYGATTYLQCRTAGYGYTEEVVLRFDLSSISGTVISAKLKMYETFAHDSMPGGGPRATPQPIDLMVLYNDSDWTEASLTYNMSANWPAGLITTFAESGTGYRPNIELADTVRTQMSGNRKIALLLASQSGRYLMFASKENDTTANRPMLVCSTSAALIRPVTRSLIVQDQGFRTGMFDVLGRTDKFDRRNSILLISDEKKLVRRVLLR